MLGKPFPSDDHCLSTQLAWLTNNDNSTVLNPVKSWFPGCNPNLALLLDTNDGIMDEQAEIS